MPYYFLFCIKHVRVSSSYRLETYFNDKLYPKVPNVLKQHIQKHNFVWFDVTGELTEPSNGTYEGWKNERSNQILPYSRDPLELDLLCWNSKLCL